VAIILPCQTPTRFTLARLSAIKRIGESASSDHIDDQMQLRALLALGPVRADAPADPTSSTVAA
jgi:hypothetical protein